MHELRSDCDCYWCEEARWELAWEAYKLTPEYEEAAAPHRQRVSQDVYFGLVKDGPNIRAVADRFVKHVWAHEAGRWERGKKAPQPCVSA